MVEPRPTVRVDKWLWFARFFRTRSLAARAVAGGRLRVNKVKVAKTSFAVGPGDILTFAQGDTVRIVRLLDTGSRRGPSAEAVALYQDLTPVKEKRLDKPQAAGKGRPTKKDRRDMRLSRDHMLE